ncbi:unnamed protein product [Fraxinus pennsylvanica]|uniref:Uncharacterized protein n=1 Tax=Fraxinus pennsylvanica TaxID=56036 RepID=A0AAD1Z603_9LAMI|nr:unnamed protein product [Fraxinus pennsylvanica]
MENAIGSMAASRAIMQYSHLAKEVGEAVEVFAEDVVMELRESELQSDDHATVVTEVLKLENVTQPQTKSSEDIEVPSLSETLSDGEEENLLRSLRKDKGYSSNIDVNFSLAKTNKQATKVRLQLWENREETRLAQKAKKKWLAEGDQNSKKFHAVVNQKRRSSHISSMRLTDKTVLASPEKVHDGAVNYFEHILRDNGTSEHGDLASLNFCSCISGGQ